MPSKPKPQPDAPKRGRGRPPKVAAVPFNLPFEPLGGLSETVNRTSQNAKKPVQNAKKSGGAYGDSLTNSVQSVRILPDGQNSADAQDVDLVRETLRAICRDPSAPAAARAQAARTLAELANALGRHAPPPPPPVTKPLAQMTRAELEAELARLGG